LNESAMSPSAYTKFVVIDDGLLKSDSQKMKKNEIFKIIKDYITAHEIRNGRLNDDDWHELWNIIKDLSHKVAIKTDKFGLEYGYVSHLRRCELRKQLRLYAITMIKKKGGD